jgi:hypothetical protein
MDMNDIKKNSLFEYCQNRIKTSEYSIANEANEKIN